jgi:hypothetical protein
MILGIEVVDEVVNEGPVLDRLLIFYQSHAECPEELRIIGNNREVTFVGCCGVPT